MNKINTSDAIIKDILERWVVDINVRKDLHEALKSWKQLRIKFWIDPSWFDLTLGHAVPLQKLRSFQQAGHQIVLLIGSFTARIWDPTWKSETRKPLSKEQVVANAAGYLNQAGKIIDISKTEVVYNWDWLEQMSFEDVLRLASTFTVQQMIHRDMFKKRIEKDQNINLVEFLYPLMQWYDSVPLKADVEIWWNDQLFNIMAWRRIQEAYGQKPQNVLTVPILVWLDWHEKMSKSLGNYIAIEDSPKEKFGKIMSIPDACILNYYELTTNVPLEEIANIKERLELWENPRNIKCNLAKEIIRFYHSAEEADNAEADFNDVFVNKVIPTDISEIKIDRLSDPVEIAFALKLVPSKSEWRRMIESWAMKIDWIKVESIKDHIRLSSWMVVQVWKRKWAKVLL